MGILTANGSARILLSGAVGKVESLWRYPVKSMRGEQLPALYLGFAGVFGDRRYAIRDSVAPKGFPYLTAREQHEMLLYRPIYRCPDRSRAPVNVLEAEAIPLGATPLPPDPAQMLLDIRTPVGKLLAIDDPALLELLRSGLRRGHELSLIRSDAPLTDCRPISLLSTQTVEWLGNGLGGQLDKRRFRANLYLNLGKIGNRGTGFGEDLLIGRTLGVGPRVVIQILDRDPRCKLITLDPETAATNINVMKHVFRENKGHAGVYAAVLVEGMVSEGDGVRILD
jgi:uncharacterized protein